jgi:hypothetical protein
MVVEDLMRGTSAHVVAVVASTMVVGSHVVPRRAALLLNSDVADQLHEDDDPGGGAERDQRRQSARTKEQGHPAEEVDVVQAAEANVAQPDAGDRTDAQDQRGHPHHAQLEGRLGAELGCSQRHDDEQPQLADPAQGREMGQQVEVVREAPGQAEERAPRFSPPLL